MAPPPPPGGYAPPPANAAPPWSASSDSAWRLDSSAGWAPPPMLPIPPASPPRSGAGQVVRVVGLVVGVVFGFAVVSILAVTLLGKSNGERPVTTGKWVTAAAPDGSFHADFPAQPVSGSVNTASGVANYLAWPDHASSNFAVEYETFPPGGSINVPGALSGAIDGMANTGAHITSTIDVPFQNNQARAFSGTLNGLPFKGLVFVDGRNLYVVLAGGQNAVAQSDRFFNSFTLTP